MCGIAGFTTFKKDYTLIESRTFIKNMCDSIQRRGPDASGYYNNRFLHLGHRRLSIIDVAGGLQPMTSADGNYTIVYNGELYNTEELRNRLKSILRDSFTLPLTRSLLSFSCIIVHSNYKITNNNK